MLHDFMAWLLSVFLIGPPQTNLQEQLAAARAPAAVVQRVQACATEAGPRLLARVETDPFWVPRVIIGSWVGLTSPEDVLRDAVAGCGPTLAAARPFLG